MSDGQVQTYGVLERFEAKDEIDECIIEFAIDGYTVLPSGLTADELAAIRAELDTLYERQSAEIGGKEVLAQINDADLVRCCLAYSQTFLNLATNAKLMEFTRRVLGENFVLLMQNGIINRPDNYQYQTRWHRDINYQHWTSSRPLALNALYCIDEFTRETGGTHVLPGTHRVDKFPSETYVRNHEKAIEAPAGSILVLDCMLFHRAGANVSNKLRRAVNHVIGLPFFGQQVSMPGMLQGAYSDDPFLSRFLGYKWNPAPDVLAWRKGKMST